MVRGQREKNRGSLTCGLSYVKLTLTEVRDPCSENFRTGKDLVLQAMVIDPLTPSPDKARTILEEFLREPKELLSIELH